MEWVRLRPENPYSGAPVTFTLSKGLFPAFPQALTLESSDGTFRLPLEGGVASVHLASAGRYTIRSGDRHYSFDVAIQREVPLQAELGMTLGVVLILLGGLIRWTKKRRAGSIFPSGQS